MALHSVSHNTGVSTDKHTWEKEIVKARGYIATLCPPLSFLSLSAGIPESEIVGFRAPDLKYNDAMLEVLHERGFLYDSSITTAPSNRSGTDASSTSRIPVCGKWRFDAAVT